MRLWRSSDHGDLSGLGGLRVSGRWHSQGARIVYLSDQPASTLLEIVVHLEVDPEDLPDTFQLMAVDIPDDVRFEAIEMDQLASGWPNNPAQTRGAGDRWLKQTKTALMRVPSALVPFAWNWLFNPAHADAAKARVAEIVPAPFDPRLFKR